MPTLGTTYTIDVYGKWIGNFHVTKRIVWIVTTLYCLSLARCKRWIFLAVIFQRVSSPNPIRVLLK